MELYGRCSYLDSSHVFHQEQLLYSVSKNKKQSYGVSRYLKSKENTVCFVWLSSLNIVRVTDGAWVAKALGYGNKVAFSWVCSLLLKDL